MNRTMLAAISAVALLMGAAGTTQAQTNDGKNRWMTVSNFSHLTAVSIYIRPAGTNWTWSHDLLGSKVIEAGQALGVNFDDGRGACNVEIRVTGRPWSYVRNVCSGTRLDLY